MEAGREAERGSTGKTQRDRRPVTLEILPMEADSPKSGNNLDAAQTARGKVLGVLPRIPARGETP
jgi:hypothetical protein